MKHGVSSYHRLRDRTVESHLCQLNTDVQRDGNDILEENQTASGKHIKISSVLSFVMRQETHPKIISALTILLELFSAPGS